MGNVVLAIYLILVGVVELAPAATVPTPVMGVLAIVAGILLLVGR